MDLGSIGAVIRPATRQAIPAHSRGDAFLAGGTWLFSEPQHHLTRLIDLTKLGWQDIAASETGLEIGATCTLSALEDFEAPRSWPAASLFRQCCRSLVGSFKICRAATVGGNLCLALPAAPMAALAVALHATCTIWRAGGAEDRLPALRFITGAGRTALAPGDILRGLHLPAALLRRQVAFRQTSLSPLGRSAALLIGTRNGDAIELTITAATERPVRLAVPRLSALAGAIDGAVPRWHDDVHGRPDWRRRVTHLLAGELCSQLLAA